MADFTQADLDAINDAIKKGVRRVQYQDKLVVYHSLAEMMQVRRMIEECLGKKKKINRALAEHDKGLC